MKTESRKKKEGFKGQRAIIIPRQILSKHCASNKVIETLYITDLGYYPNAKFHFRQRPNGADQHILIYCHEGLGHARIRDTHYKIEAGEFLIFPAKMPHQYESDYNHPWTIYWLHFKGTTSLALVELLKKHSGSLKGSIKYPERSLQLFDEIYGEFERGYGIDHLMYANMCFNQFFTSLLFNDKFDQKGVRKDRTAIDLAIDFMTARVDQTLSLEDIAECATLSPAHFSVLFKKKTGFSPIEYFNHIKVQKACQYLQFTELRIKEIALELGIGDPYYFSRLFTKVMGISPADYRDSRRGPGSRRSPEKMLG